MVRNFIITAVVMLSIVIAASCKSRNDSTVAEEEQPAQEELVTPDDDDAVRDKVYLWLKALNTNDTQLNYDVYAPTVKFYGETYTDKKCAQAREDLLSKQPGYKQTIDGYIDIEDMDGGRKKASFTKSTDYHGEPHSYEAYLIFARQSDGDWRIVEESDLTTDRNLAKRRLKKSANVPKDAISGDFDGDGVAEWIWVTARMDDDGYAETPFTLRATTDAMAGKQFNSSRGVQLINLGSLAGDGCDYLGVVPYSDSSWCVFYTYRFKDGRWQEAIESFTIWEGDEYSGKRVTRASRKGNVKIHYNNMGSDDFSVHTREVALQL